MDLPVSEIPKRKTSRFVCTKLGLWLKAAHDHWSINGNMVIHMESPHGELLIDRLCSAFPSECNMLYIFVYSIDFVEFCLCSAKASIVHAELLEAKKTSK